MPRKAKEDKYVVIEERRDHFVIFYGKQRTIMTAMVWERWVAELVCGILNIWQSTNKLTQE